MEAETIENMTTNATATVLVVDDTPANLSVLLDLLTGAGFAVLVADSGERALLQIAHRQPDVILLDALMPGLDGFETCRRLRADPATRSLPVLFMTALTDTAARLAGFAAGAVDYISKPFEPEEVLARLRAQLELQRLRRALEAEVRLRQSAEAQLERSLAQAMLIVDAESRIVFCARTARQLLVGYLDGFDPATPLPDALLQGQRIAHASGRMHLRARRFAEGSDDGLKVLLLKEEAPDPSLVLLHSLGLTEREAEVLYWVAQGKTSPEIAIILGSALKTVKKHLQRVYGKLGVETRTTAAVRASEILSRHAES
ncbi:MAG: response regulator [Rhodospirillales bacterium]|nr:response regulator [Acetobacter sp.]